MLKRLRPGLSAQYLLLTLSVLLAYLHHGVFNVLLPAGLTEMSGTEFAAGVALALFGVVSFSTRPFVGTKVDAIGGYAVLVGGVAVLAVSGFVLALPIVGAIMLANAVRGVGWAAVNTGGSVMVAEFASEHNRGRLSGYYTIAQSLATSVAPAFALMLMGIFSYSTVAVIGAGFAVAAVLVGRTIHKSQERSWRILPPGLLRGSVRTAEDGSSIERRALLPAALLVCLTLIHPGMTSFVPLYARAFQLELWAASLYFIVYGSTSVIIRLLLSSYSDRFGRLYIAAAGYGSVLVGLGAVVLFPSEGALLFAGFSYALGQSMVVPALMALVMDRVDRSRMGAGMATYSAAFQVGASAGAFFLGWGLSALSYQASYALLSVGPLLGIAASLGSAWRLSPSRSA